MRLVRKVSFAFALAVLGVAAGAALGALYYNATAQFPDYGYEFEGFAETLAGAAAGLLAGGFSGWIAFGPLGLPPRRRLGAAVACIAGAILVVVGLYYMGELTNADGGVPPQLLLVPAGSALVALAVRVARSPTPER